MRSVESARIVVARGRSDAQIPTSEAASDRPPLSPRILGQDPRAVTDVVGSMAMLAITVLVFVAVSLFVLWELDEGPDVAHSDFRFDARNGNVVLRHVGGLAIPLQQIVIEVQDENGLEVYGTSDLAPLLPDGAWNLGDSVCVVGPAPTCLRSAPAQSARFIVGGAVLAAHGGPA